MGIRNNIGLVTSPLLAGVERLPAALTINGSTEYPVFRYKGGDATISAWPAWGYGEDLSIAGAGTDVTPNQGSPILGDDSVDFNANKYFTATGSTGDITTEDFVLELVFRMNNGTARRMMGTRGVDAGNSGWEIYSNAGPLMTLYLDAGAAGAGTNTGNLTEGAWYHAIIFVDRSGSAQWYINGVASGSAVDVSAAAGSASSSTPLRIGGVVLGILWNEHIAYAAMWKKDNWLDTHLQATVARERFSLYTGNTSLHNHGDSTPVLL